MSKTNNGKIWPYSIGISIFIVFLAAIATVIIANKLPVEKSDTYMMGYHEADAKANELIEAKIAFNKKYNLSFLTNSLHVEGSNISYKLTDKSNNVINNAKIILVVTRPNEHEHDQKIQNAEVKDGVYTFKNIKLPLKGRWDIMAKVVIGKNERFLNFKMDTRSKGAYEY